MQHGTGKGKALLLAAAHGARKLLLLVAEVIALEQLLDSCRALASGIRVDRANKLQVFDDGHVTEQRKLLRHVADSRLEPPCVAGHLGIEDDSIAVTGHQQAAKHAYCRRLARSIRPEEAVNFPARHVEIQLADGDEIAETLGEPACFDRELPVHWPLSGTSSSTSTGTPSGSRSR